MRPRLRHFLFLAAALLAALFPAAAHAASSTPVTMTFDSGQLRLSGFPAPFAVVDETKPVKLNADMKPSGRFSVKPANFRFPASTISNVLPGVNVTVRVTPLQRVTGSYSRKTGKLTTDATPYRLQFNPSGAFTATCVVTPVPIALSTEIESPFEGDRFDRGLPPGDGALAGAWASLPPTDACGLVDPFITGAGGIQLGISRCQGARGQEVVARAEYKRLVKKGASSARVKAAKRAYEKARAKRQKACGEGPPTPGNKPPTFPAQTVQKKFSRQYSVVMGQPCLSGQIEEITLSPGATDPDGDPLTYTWTATSGTISGSGLTSTWQRIVTNCSTFPGTATVTASDGKGGTATYNVQG